MLTPVLGSPQNAPTPATAATPGYASALTPGAPTPGPTEYSRASSSYDREAASAPTPGSGMFNGELDVTNDGDLWGALYYSSFRVTETYILLQMHPRRGLQASTLIVSKTNSWCKSKALT